MRNVKVAYMHRKLGPFLGEEDCYYYMLLNAQPTAKSHLRVNREEDAKRFVLFLFVFDFGVRMEKSGRFPEGKPAATESRYPALINY